MERVYIGSKRIKNITIGGKRVRKVYLGNQCVYGGGEVGVAYHIDKDTVLYANKTFYEGDDALKINLATDLRKKDGTVVNPTTAKSGWTLIGWRTDTEADSNVVNRYILPEAKSDLPIDLYAVYTQTKTVKLYTPVADLSKSPAYSSKTVSRYSNQENIKNGSCQISLPEVKGIFGYGWTYTASSPTIQYTPEANITNITDNLTLYGVYYVPVRIYASGYNYTNNNNSGNNYYVCNTSKCSQTGCKLAIPDYSPQQPTGYKQVDTNGWTTSMADNWATVTRYSERDLVTLYNDLIIYQIYFVSNILREYKSTIYPQYNTQRGSIYYIPAKPVTYPPTYKVTSATYSGWNWAGYCYNNGADMTIDVAPNGSVTPYSDFSIYAIYTKTVSLKLYNGESSASYKSGTKYLKIRHYNNDTESTYEFIKNPDISISQKDYSGWEKVGWSTTPSVSGAKVYNPDDTVYGVADDSTVLYSKYSRTLTTWVNGNDAAVATQNPIQYGLYGDWGYLSTDSPFVTLSAYDSGIWTVSGWNTSGQFDVSYAPTSTIDTPSGIKRQANARVSNDKVTFFSVFSTPYNRNYSIMKSDGTWTTSSLSDGTNMLLCNGSYTSKTFTFPSYSSFAQLPGVEANRFLFWNHGGDNVEYYANQSKTITMPDFNATAVYLPAGDMPQAHIVTSVVGNSSTVTDKRGWLYSTSCGERLDSRISYHPIDLYAHINIPNMPSGGIMVNFRVLDHTGTGDSVIVETGYRHINTNDVDLYLQPTILHTATKVELLCVMANPNSSDRTSYQINATFNATKIYERTIF